MPTQAFKVQRGTLIIGAGSTSATITAGVDYDAPASLSSAFIRINSTRFTGMGNTVGGGSQNADDTSARINNPGNLLTSIDFTRVGTANPCRVTWEIVEYVGAAGGANEFIVRDQGLLTASTGTTLTGSTVTSIADINKACLWLTSQSSADTGRADWHEYLWTGALVANASDWDPQFSKLAAALNSSAWVSYAVIEFTGSNWRNVQRAEFTTTGATWTSAEDSGAGFTVAIPSALLDVNKAFVHVQYATSNDATGLDDAGDCVTIDSTTNFRVWNRVATGTRRKVVWVIENTQADATARNMTVQHNEHFEDNGGTEERVSTITVTAVDALAETSVMGSVSVDGSGTAYPRGCVDLNMTNTTTVEKRTSDSGQEQQYCIEIIEWPEDPDAGTTGSGSSSLALTSSADGTRSTIGGGASALALAASADGSVTRPGAGSSSLALSAQADGTRSTVGAGATALALAAQADGVRSVSGAGASALALTSAADGVRSSTGGGASALALSATANGIRSTVGAGSSSLALTAQADGAKNSTATGSSALALATQADGTRSTVGAGSSALALTAQADGIRSTAGAGSTALALAAQANAIRSTVGAGAVALALAAQADGQRSSTGAGAIAMALTATAAAAGNQLGAGSTSLALATQADGVRSTVGGGAAALALTAQADGVRAAAGAGSVALALAIQAGGIRETLGAGALAMALTVQADGSVVGGGAIPEHYGNTFMGGGLSETRISGGLRTTLAAPQNRLNQFRPSLRFTGMRSFDPAPQAPATEDLYVLHSLFTQSADANTMLVNGLDGDADEFYRIIGDILITPGAGGLNLDCLPNGSNTDLTCVYHPNSQATTNLANRWRLLAQPTTLSGHHHYRFSMEIHSARTINAVSRVRSYRSQAEETFILNPTVRDNLWYSAGGLHNSLANLTSLLFDLDGSANILASSQIRVYTMQREVA